MLIEDTYEKIRNLARDVKRLNTEYLDILTILQAILSDNKIFECIENNGEFIEFKCCEKSFLLNKTLKRKEESVVFEIKVYERTKIPVDGLNEVLTFNLFPDALTDIENSQGQPLCASDPSIARFIIEKSILNSIEPKN